MTSDEAWADILLKQKHEDGTYTECLYAWADWAEEQGRNGYGLRWLGKHHRDPRGNRYDNTVWWCDHQTALGHASLHDENIWYWYLPSDVYKKLRSNTEWTVKKATKYIMVDHILAAAEAVCAARTDDHELSMPYLLGGGPVEPSRCFYRPLRSGEKRHIESNLLGFHK